MSDDGIKCAVLLSKMASLHVLLPSAQVNITELSRDVIRKVPIILADARQVVDMTSYDEAAQMLKNAKRVEGDRKAPLLSRVRIEELEAETIKATAAYQELVRSLDKLALIKREVTLAKVTRKVVQKGRDEVRYHCEHCQGRPARCGCGSDCPRTPTCTCTARHCLHCKGDRGPCECAKGCDRPGSVECRAKKGKPQKEAEPGQLRTEEKSSTSDVE
jgi:hypothetical protein